MGGCGCPKILRGSGRGELGVVAVDVVHGDGVGGDDVSHLLDLCLEGCDIIVVSPDGRFGLIVLLLQDFLFRGDSLQLLREGLGGGLKLLSLGDQFFQF